MSTCGEKPANVDVKNISFAQGCLNAHTVASALGTSEQEVNKASEESKQRPGKCHCLNNKVDILSFDDTCFSSCAYCYARHGSDSAYTYYNEDGTLKNNSLTMTRRLENSNFDYENAEFYSGGAVGSDTEWANIAKQYGIKVKEYLVSDFDKLPQEWKDRLDAEYKYVVNILGRKELPIDSYSGKLVRRDMMQADKADAVFAIARIGESGEVLGGTAYAVTRAEQRGIPVYLYDQNDEKWLYSVYEDGKIQGYLEFNGIPTLTTNAAVIGTREINESGKQAIKDVFQKTLVRQEEQKSTTAQYGVVLTNGSKELKETYQKWQEEHPEGIVAYRINFDSYNTPYEVQKGHIGNPFSENSKGEETVKRFYTWIIKGTNFGNPKATERFRQAIIRKLLETPDGSPVLYYTELGRPSHATVIGYLINHKELLKPIVTESEEFYSAEDANDHARWLIYAEEVPKEDIQVIHTPGTETEDDYWTVVVKKNNPLNLSKDQL